MVKAVVFDLDDTLVSEKEYIRSGYRHISEVINKRYVIDKDQIYSDLMQLYKESPRNVFNRLYDNYHINYTKNMIVDLVKEYRGHFPDIHLYDDVIPCVTRLKNMGIKIGIITDGYAIAQRQKIKAVQLVKYFDEIIITDELGRGFWKPHPKAFELIKDKFKIEFEEMIYVGDNPEKDFYISKTHPIKTVRILRDGVHKDKDYFNGIFEMYEIQYLAITDSITSECSEHDEKSLISIIYKLDH